METKITGNDLQQYFEIVNTTIDFRTENFEGKSAFEDYNPIDDYYKQEKTAAAIYFSSGNLTMLKEQFEKLSSGLSNNYQERFSIYLKSKTGFEIDVTSE